MREYALGVTAALTAMMTAEGMFAFTAADVIEIMFTAVVVGVIAGAVFGIVTQPRKKKARWEKAGGLEVLVQGRRTKR